MTASKFGLFVLATLLISLSPGPNVFLLLSLGLRDGAGAVLRAVGGIAVASLLFLMVSALGLVAALTASLLLFRIVSGVGALYLMYLGVRLIVASRRGATLPTATPLRPLPRPFVQGFVTHLANPKAMLYWSALLPQFIVPQRGLAAQVLMLGCIAIGLDATILTGYGLFAAAARRSALSGRFERGIMLVGGVFFVCAGALLGVAQWRGGAP